MNCNNFLCRSHSVITLCNCNGGFSGEDSFLPVKFVPTCPVRKMYNRIVKNSTAGIDGMFREERDKYYGRKK